MRIVIIFSRLVMEHTAMPETPEPVPCHGTTLPASQISIPSSSLLQGGQTVQIQHGGAVYTLRATRSGKLILTK